MIDEKINPDQSESTDIQIVELVREPIELYKILKFEGLVGSGGEAKAAIADGHVKVNGDVETQKRKKIISGDTIEFADTLLQLQMSEIEVLNTERESKKESKPAEISMAKLDDGNRKNVKDKREKKKQTVTRQDTRRKAISLRSKVKKNDK